MWPKALSQIIELLPHLSRLLPMADRFLNAQGLTKAQLADAEASRSAMQQMAEGLRGDLGQVTAAHAGLYNLFHEQGETLSTLSANIASLIQRTATIESRLDALERQGLLNLGFIIGIFALLVGLFTIAIYFLIHHA
jgi:hypothetical protein